MNRWKSWGELPEFMKNEYTLRYYRRLSRKRGSMALKRIFDVKIGRASCRERV